MYRKIIFIFSLLIITLLGTNSCCKYVIEPSTLVLDFKNISDKEFDQLKLNVDTLDYFTSDYSKDYNFKLIQINFRDPISVDQSITNVGDSIYMDTIFNIQAKIVKRSKGCGDTNKTGVSFTHNNLYYDKNSHHRILIAR